MVRKATVDGMAYVDEQYRKIPGLKRRVEAQLAEMDIERALLDLRQASGLTQAQLAARVGVKQPVIARIEAGRSSNIHLRTILQIATALGARVRVTLEPASEKRKRKAKAAA
jgi:DNA-binding XRE family transcriptional regulator